MDEQRKPPIYESKTIQVYPDDYYEREAIRFYEAGLWGLVSNNRTQETHGNTVSTFSRLIFRRDKNMPHYAEIAAASAQLESLQGHHGSSANLEKYEKDKKKYGCLGAAFMIYFFPLGIVFLVKRSKAKKKIAEEQKNANENFRQRVTAAFAHMEEVKRQCGY